nr:MAG TPA: hypothetical protein [Caudoviricetes sp.]
MGLCSAYMLELKQQPGIVTFSMVPFYVVWV